MAGRKRKFPQKFTIPALPVDTDDGDDGDDGDEDNAGPSEARDQHDRQDVHGPRRLLLEGETVRDYHEGHEEHGANHDEDLDISSPKRQNGDGIHETDEPEDPQQGHREQVIRMDTDFVEDVHAGNPEGVGDHHHEQDANANDEQEQGLDPLDAFIFEGNNLFTILIFCFEFSTLLSFLRSSLFLNHHR